MKSIGTGWGKKRHSTAQPLVPPDDRCETVRDTHDGLQSSPHDAQAHTLEETLDPILAGLRKRREGERDSSELHFEHYSERGNRCS